jgi:predicted MPP superfamily phosphohydrolase
VPQLLILIVVVLAVVGGVHTYLYRRLVRATTEPGRARRVGLWVVVALAVLLPATLVGTRVLPSAVSTPLAMAGYVWLALMFYLLVFLLLGELVRLGVRVFRRRAAPAAVVAAPVVATPVPAGGVGSPPVAAPAETVPDPSRRRLLARGIAVGAAVAAAGTVGYGMTEALGRPRLKRVPIALAKLPRRMDGTRVAVVSDIHLGPLAGRAHTSRIVDIINSLDTDFVAVVGDLVDGTVAELGAAAEPLRGLRSRYGGYFVTGNHEYFSGYAPWVDEVTELGLRVLRNERVEIGDLLLAGVNDRTGGQYGDAPDYGRALADRDPARPCVLLAHQPVQAHEAARYGVDLQLSGHTHGGQMVPFNLLVRLDQPIVSGLGRVDGMPVYVTNGAGFWGPPVRVGAHPDITLIELRAAG